MLKRRRFINFRSNKKIWRGFKLEKFKNYVNREIFGKKLPYRFNSHKRFCFYKLSRFSRRFWRNYLKRNKNFVRISNKNRNSLFPFFSRLQYKYRKKRKRIRFKKYLRFLKKKKFKRGLLSLRRIFSLFPFMRDIFLPFNYRFRQIVTLSKGLFCNKFYKPPFLVPMLNSVDFFSSLNTTSILFPQYLSITKMFHLSSKFFFKLSNFFLIELSIFKIIFTYLRLMKKITFEKTPSFLVSLTRINFFNYFYFLFFISKPYSLVSLKRLYYLFSNSLNSLKILNKFFIKDKKLKWIFFQFFVFLNQENFYVKSINYCVLSHLVFDHQ